MAHPLLIFDTHPIQYRSPVFQKLSGQFPNFKVYFFNDSFNGKKWWFQEFGKVSTQDFGLSLREGFESEVLTLNQQSLIQKIITIRRILLQEKPQCILLYGYYQVEHWVLYFLAWKMGISLIFIGETYDWTGSWLRKGIKKIWVGSFFKRVASFVSVGKKTKEYYLSWGINPSRIVEAKYCTDPQLFWVPKEESEILRKKTRLSLGIPTEAFVLLFVGRLFSRKRPQDLVQIQKSLSHLKDLHTILVGSGELSEALSQEAKGVERLHFVGFKNQIDLKPFYYAADVLVVPSEFETWGLVVNEAFACGVPALVTENCGVADDLVVSGETGEIFRVGEWKEAANKIEAWVKDRKKVQALGQQAQKRVLKSYLPEHFSRKIQEAFNLAISEPI